MPESPIQRLIPKAEDLLRLTVQELAPVLLKLAHDRYQYAGFIPEAVCDVAINEGYPSWKKEEVETHLTRAWNWIERKGLIEPSPGINGRNGWRMFTDDGEAVAKGADVDAITLSKDFPRSLLHEIVVARCDNLFRSGHYAQAVELSFKVVRDRLRQLTGYEKGADAFGRGKLTVHGAIAPNVERDFNEGVKFLTMAIDMFRNEKSHTAEIGIDDPRKAVQYLILSSLAMRLLDRAEVL
jgi:uncharacterized protein (TIGR02391 family)